jgi:nitrogenase subunit NifH
MKAKLLLVAAMALSPSSLLAAAAQPKLDSTKNLNIPDIPLDTGLKDIATTLSFIAAVVATIFLVIGGIRYITSNGNPSGIESAKRTITYAIAGLIVSILAAALVGFVLSRGPQ